MEIHIFSFEKMHLNIICQTSAILSLPQYVKQLTVCLQHALRNAEPVYILKCCGEQIIQEIHKGWHFSLEYWQKLLTSNIQYHDYWCADLYKYKANRHDIKQTALNIIFKLSFCLVTDIIIYYNLEQCLWINNYFIHNSTCHHICITIR